jgi:hypothetical protein
LPVAIIASSARRVASGNTISARSVQNLSRSSSSALAPCIAARATLCPTFASLACASAEQDHEVGAVLGRDHFAQLRALEPDLGVRRGSGLRSAPRTIDRMSAMEGAVGEMRGRRGRVDPAATRGRDRPAYGSIRSTDRNP